MRNSAGEMRSVADGRKCCMHAYAIALMAAVVHGYRSVYERGTFRESASLETKEAKPRARCTQMDYSMTVEVNLETRPTCLIMLAVLMNLSLRLHQEAYCSLTIRGQQEALGALPLRK